MESQAKRNRYWDTQAETATFTLPVDVDRIEGHLPYDARILDFGCGYGRTLRALLEAGFSEACGVDPSAGMVERCKSELPAATVSTFDGLPMSYASASFDAVLVVAVLTCLPEDGEQQALVDEAQRLLKPGGYLYISDFLLNDDTRNRERYEAGHSRFGTYGVFSLPDGAVHRHHERSHLAQLLASFDEIEYLEFAAFTRNGNPSNAFTTVARRHA